jgi:hypothetical protein
MVMRAQWYYHTPTGDGGGGRSFASITLGYLTGRPVNAYGSFDHSSPTATLVVLDGTGVETGLDGSSPVAVQVTVYADSLTMVVNN